MDGYISKIHRFSTTAGPGLRTAVMAVGCPMKCLWCNTPELMGQAMKYVRHPGKCLGCGACITDSGDVTTCLYETYAKISETVTARELAARLLLDKTYYDYSGGGITYTGGDPAMQADFFCRVTKIVKKSKVHVALETTGCFEWGKLEPLIKAVDLVTLDIKAIDSGAHERCAGVGNALILENARKIAGMGVDMIANLLLVPGISDSDAEIIGRLEFVKSLGKHVKVNIIKYRRNSVAGETAGLQRAQMPDDTPDCCEETAKYAVAAATRMGLEIAKPGAPTR